MHSSKGAIALTLTTIAWVLLQCAFFLYLVISTDGCSKCLPDAGGWRTAALRGAAYIIGIKGLLDAAFLVTIRYFKRRHNTALSFTLTAWACVIGFLGSSTAIIAGIMRCGKDCDPAMPAANVIMMIGNYGIIAWPISIWLLIRYAARQPQPQAG